MQPDNLKEDISTTEKHLQFLKLEHVKFKKALMKVLLAGILVCFSVLALNLSYLVTLPFKLDHNGLKNLATELQLFFKSCAALLTVLAFMFLVRRSRETEIQIANTELQILHSKQQQQVTLRQNRLNEFFLRKKEFVETMERLLIEDKKYYFLGKDVEIKNRLNYNLLYECLHDETYFRDDGFIDDLTLWHRDLSSLFLNIQEETKGNINTELAGNLQTCFRKLIHNLTNVYVITHYKILNLEDMRGTLEFYRDVSREIRNVCSYFGRPALSPKSSFLIQNIITSISFPSITPQERNMLNHDLTIQNKQKRFEKSQAIKEIWKSIEPTKLLNEQP